MDQDKSDPNTENHVASANNQSSPDYAFIVMVRTQPKNSFSVVLYRQSWRRCRMNKESILICLRRGRRRPRGFGQRRQWGQRRICIAPCSSFFLCSSGQVPPFILLRQQPQNPHMYYVIKLFLVSSSSSSLVDVKVAERKKITQF